MPRTAQYTPALVAQAIHDVTCPEGPECRDRLLHSAAQTLANSGVLARFLERLAELEGGTCGWRGFAGGGGCVRRTGHDGRHGFADGSGEQDQ